MFDFTQTFYLAGYEGRMLPRWVRRRIARTDFHRAWLLGSLGYFVQGGVHYGPAHPYPSGIEEAVHDRD